MYLDEGMKSSIQIENVHDVFYNNKYCHVYRILYEFQG